MAEAQRGNHGCGAQANASLAGWFSAGTGDTLLAGELIRGAFCEKSCVLLFRLSVELQRASARSGAVTPLWRIETLPAKRSWRRARARPRSPDRFATCSSVAWPPATRTRTVCPPSQRGVHLFASGGNGQTVACDEVARRSGAPRDYLGVSRQPNLLPSANPIFPPI
jgi:hypothetical protein